MPRKPQEPLTIILLGDPAAGKATQAEFLADRYNLFDFDMGKELADLRLKDEAINKNLSNNNDKGKLTPTAIVRNILRTKISEIPTSKGILFDGHPKMLGEAKLVAQLLAKQNRPNPLVIYLSLPMEETVRRMHDRVGYFSGKYGKRADDSDTALKNRIKYYRVNIAAVVDFFSSKFEYHKMSALGSRAEVKKNIEAIVKSFLAKKSS